MKTPQKQKLLLAHGGGGKLSQDLIEKHILPRLQNPTLAKLSDSAMLNLNGETVMFTTDSYVVKPLFFNGGDIGKLAVCGTINDLAVAGAKPAALSLSLIVETGLDMDILDQILDSIGKTAAENDVEIVTGDTKTVETASADQIFINTAGIGLKMPKADLGFEKIRPGDKIIINGTIGDHGLTVISQRKGIEFESSLESDCAALASLTCLLLENVDGIKFMRDPTRGGIAMALNEICRNSSLGIEIEQSALPINPVAQAAADLLGLDLLNIANEGKVIMVTAPQAAKKCLDICRNHPLGKDAAIIGTVGESANEHIVELKTEIGGRRIVQVPYGRELPRIC